jgi:hypothetical protein
LEFGLDFREAKVQLDLAVKTDFDITVLSDSLLRALMCAEETRVWYIYIILVQNPVMALVS